jgi:ribosomal protein S12 methylthiotransferase
MSRSRRSALPVLSREPAAAGSVVFASADDTTFRLVTLGCDKNTVDSERLRARLAAAGARLSDAEADVILVNTCGFIEAAREESIETLLDAVRLKTAGRARAVVALGCLVQRYQGELVRELPEVDLFLGLTEIERLLPELRRRGLLREPMPGAANMERPLRLLGPGRKHTSFLKVSEGCDHSCAFCAIPLMRGKHRSTPIDVLVREAQELEAAGVVELSLVSQDTTWYGRDVQRGAAAGPDAYFIGRPFAGMAGSDGLSAPAVRNGHTPGASRRGQLTALLRTLLAETGIPWLRLFYMYPSGIQPELIELIASEPRIVNYLDMPIQHGSDAVLRRMRRPERQESIRERVHGLRQAIPDIALRSTVIVGFPGETEDDFEAMLELLEELRFDHLGAFAYSVEENTPAATMDGAVADVVKRERLERVLDLQRSMALERNEGLVGREATVLIDQVTGRASEAETGRRGAVGRTAGQAIEIDGVVHFASAGGVRPGVFVRARITDALEHDMVAELIAPGV